MSHGGGGEAARLADPPATGALAGAARVAATLNRGIERIGGIALVAASLILTYSVVTRYFFKAATDWQDEAAVFCLVGAVFLASAGVQAQRGHIGIEALAAILPDRVNRVRALVVDVVSAGFCSFFAWKSWTLWYEAWSEHQTSSSSWAPPLWIPYSLMAIGTTLLAAQILLQVGAALGRARGGA